VTSRELYCLAVRLAGLVFWVFGAFALVHIIALPLGMPLPARFSLSTAIVTLASWVALGLAATFGANALTRFVYGK
jgi:hypothetical protein